MGDLQTCGMDVGASPTLRSISHGEANSRLVHHYLGAITPARILCAQTDGDAVAVFGRPTRGNVRFGFSATELIRLWSPDDYLYLSRFLSRALRILRHDYPSVALVVAYADGEVGHHGGIYRASNWFNFGRARQGGPAALIIDGERVHARTVNHRYGHANQKRLREELGLDVQAIPRMPKFIYYYPLNRQVRRRLEQEIEHANQAS